MKKILFLMLISASFVLAQDSTKLIPDSTKHIQDTTQLSVDTTKYNGNWWKSLGSFDQIPFLTGIFDGLSLGATVVIDGFHVNDICYQTGTAAADDLFRRLDTIRVGHMYEQLDSLYSEPANININFDHAFRYIVYKLSGYEKPKLQKLLELYRKDNKVK